MLEKLNKIICIFHFPAYLALSILSILSVLRYQWKSAETFGYVLFSDIDVILFLLFPLTTLLFFSVQFSHSVVSDS